MGFAIRKRVIITWRSAFVAVLIASGVGCQDDSEREEAGDRDGAIEGAANVATAELTRGRGEPELLAEIDTPSGSTMRFFAAGEADGVFMLEEGQDGELILDLVTEELANGDIDAYDVYVALSEADGTRAEVPPTILELATDRPRASARMHIDVSDLTGASRPQFVDIACNNATFTASTPGGLLSTVWTRLDTNENNDPSLWWTDPTIGYNYSAGWNSITQWRGKSCGKEISGSSATTTFEYWNSGLGHWSIVGYGDFDGTAKSFAWYWDGPGTLNWRLGLWNAAANDQFDVLMSKP